MTAAAAELLTELAERAHFVPVTTRTQAQLARVRLPARVEYAIAANGGHILRHGVADDDWSRKVARRMTSVTAFAEARRRSAALANAFAGRCHEVDGLFCFAVLPTVELSADAVATELDWAQRNGWRVSVQGRKIYWVPHVLTKSAAVLEVARRCAAQPILAAGDSLLDADLFDVAVAGIRPAHGELATAGFDRPHVVGTASSGAAAGTEIVRWFASRVGSGGQAPTGLAPPAAAQQ
jgi:hypothetical protein